MKLYASEWRNFVEITDIYEERLFVSCAEADRLVEELTPPTGNRPEDDDEENEEDDEAAAEDSAKVNGTGR